MEKNSAGLKKFFLEYFKQISLALAIALAILGILLGLQMRGIYILYISPTKYHAILFPGVELLLLGSLYFSFLKSSREKIALFMQILAFLLLTTLHYQPYYWFYMNENRIIYLSPWVVLGFRFVNILLTALTVFLMLRWQQAAALLYKEAAFKIKEYAGRFGEWLETGRNEDQKEWEQVYGGIQAQEVKWKRIGLILFQIMLVWLVIAANKSSFVDYMPNELDTLPIAYQFVNSDWLENDWYLNLNVSYRAPYNFLIGMGMSLWGFKYSAIVMRLFLYLLFSISLYVFFRTFRLPLPLGILAVYFFLNHQSLASGEWIVNGVDTKTIAYSFVLLACAAFFKNKYLLGFLFSGAALSFHILVGLYSAFCVGLAVILNLRTFEIKWGNFFKQSWIYFVSGALGLAAIFDMLFSGAAETGNVGWKIYVSFLGRHLTPTWKGVDWKWELAAAVCLFSILYIFWRSRASRFIAAYALGSAFLFFVGLLIYRVGDVTLMRFYWFRFPDVIVPLFSMILIASILARLSKQKNEKSSRFFQGLFLAAAAFLVLQSAWTLVVKIRALDVENNWRYSENWEMFAWIAENTPKDAVFFTDPQMASFYLEAQRAMFVAVYHTPQSADELVEWSNRIILSNGDQPLPVGGYSAEKDFTPNFYSLDEEYIRDLAQEYGLDYYLGVARDDLFFPQVFSTEELTLYEID